MADDGGAGFEREVRRLTGQTGKFGMECGLRLVVNTRAGPSLRAGLRCLAQFGRLMHLNREDMLAASTIGAYLIFQDSENQYILSTR